MATARIVKSVALVALLLASAGLFGQACSRAYMQYEAAFIPGRELLDLALWVVGTASLLVVSGALVAALVRPFWAMAVGFAASSAAMLVVLGLTRWAGALAFVYLALSLMYAKSAVADMDNRIAFTVQSFRAGQDTLFLAAAILVAVCMGLGYREDSTRRGFLLPPAYKQTMMDTVLPVMGSLLPGGGGAGAEELARQGLERFWSEIEGRLRPYAEYVPIGFALFFFFVLETILRLISWVPPLVLNLLIRLFAVVGMTRVVTQTTEVRRLVLS